MTTDFYPPERPPSQVVYWDGKPISEVVQDFTRDGFLILFEDHSSTFLTRETMEDMRHVQSLQTRYDRIYGVERKSTEKTVRFKWQIGVAIFNPRSVAQQTLSSAQPETLSVAQRSTVERIKRRTGIIGRFGFGGRYASSMRTAA